MDAYLSNPTDLNLWGYYDARGEYRSVIPRVGGRLYGWDTGYRLYQ